MLLGRTPPSSLVPMHIVMIELIFKPPNKALLKHYITWLELRCELDARPVLTT